MKLTVGTEVIEVSAERVRDAQMEFLSRSFDIPIEHVRLINAILSHYCKCLYEEVKIPDLQPTIDFLNAMPLNTEVAEAIGKAIGKVIEGHAPQASLVDRLNAAKAKMVESNDMQEAMGRVIDEARDPLNYIDLRDGKQETWRDRPPML